MVKIFATKLKKKKTIWLVASPYISIIMVEKTIGKRALLPFLNVLKVMGRTIRPSS
jgi:hypothetical protein